MIELDIINPDVSCDGCGACCMHIRTPPFLVYLDLDLDQPRPMDDFREDCDRLRAAPQEARSAMLDGIHDDRPDDAPCSWFDQVAKRCRWYEFRPSICCDYLVGGESCNSARMGYTVIISAYPKLEEEAA